MKAADVPVDVLLALAVRWTTPPTGCDFDVQAWGVGVGTLHS